ncbi:MAG TPA: fused MFS/spermidine synthase [Gemmatimonadaceae bacterium]|nr:fused MFS/spermidine synthase [Gemmatimonadaceae bacterium]
MADTTSVAPTARPRRMLALLVVVFVLSGGAGLIYESIWSRYLGLFVGHSAYAQIIVLAIFLGGMSIGALLIGKHSHRMREPLLGYAAVELVVGLIGLVFHPIFQRVTEFAYDSLLSPVAGSAWLIVIKWTIAALLILPQSVLLGMTFPLMTAGAIRRVQGRTGHTLALLYFANSLGAAVGVLVAGFWLIRLFGLPGTLATAAVINIVVAVVIYAAVRWPAALRKGALGPVRVVPTEALPATAPIEVPDDSRLAAAGGASSPGSLRHPSTASTPATHLLWRLMLTVSFGTAVASFMYEIVWIRMLSLVLGSATHSFELMLSAFILGLALGSLWIRSYADRLTNPVLTLGMVQWAMGLLALATLPVYLWSFEWMASLLGALQATDSGYRFFTIARYVVSLTVMLPATFAAGITLPLITRTLLESGRGERAIGYVYGINTLGSIAGVVLAGIVLMPLVGLKALLIYGAILDIVLGIVLVRLSADLRTSRGRTVVYGTAVAAAVAVMAANLGVTFEHNVLASGVYRYGRIPPSDGRDIFFYEDGRTASVAAGVAGGRYYISTNGKPDASLDSLWVHKAEGEASAERQMTGDETTQAFLPLISLAHRPDAQSAAVIGQGSGMTSHFLLGSPAMREVVTIEIEPEMIAGSRAAFYPANARVFDDPRSTFVIDDAKSYFASGRRRFDLIISEPSNPWVSGVSGLFTIEFYQRARQYLTDDGLFAQWLHLYEIDDELVLSVLSALHHSFQAYDIFHTSKGDILILASNRQAIPRPDWSVFQFAGVREDLSHTIPFTPRLLDATRIGGHQEFAPLLDRWPHINSDFYPVLDLKAERSRFLRRNAVGVLRLVEERIDIMAPFTGRRIPFATETSDPAPHISRIHSLTAGALLRAPQRIEDSLRLAMDEDLAAQAHRGWQFRASLAGGPPPDWRQWVRDMVRVEHELHAGTTGVADSAFYAAIRGFASRHGAPIGARHAIDFAEAMATWDFETASRAADALLPFAMERRSWYEFNALRTGAVVAKLRIGDPAGARRYLVELGKLGANPTADLRMMLLNAYLLQAEREE